MTLTRTEYMLTRRKMDVAMANSLEIVQRFMQLHERSLPGIVTRIHFISVIYSARRRQLNGKSGRIGLHVSTTHRIVIKMFYDRSSAQLATAVSLQYATICRWWSGKPWQVSS